MHEHPYRTHTCEVLRRTDEGTTVRLSGWVHRKRDHGSLLFIDLRDHYGITQAVITPESGLMERGESLRTESVVSLKGKVVPRSDETVNEKLSTGHIELVVEEMTVLGPAETLPITVADEKPYPEETRLKYRFLDLRRDQLHRNIVLRSHVISSIRRRMVDLGFT